MDNPEEVVKARSCCCRGQAESAAICLLQQSIKLPPNSLQCHAVMEDVINEKLRDGRNLKQRVVVKRQSSVAAWRRNYWKGFVSQNYSESSFDWFLSELKPHLAPWDNLTHWAVLSLVV